MADRVPNNRKPVIRPFKPSYAGARGMTRKELYDHIQGFQKVAATTDTGTQTAAPTATSAPASAATGGSDSGGSVTLSNLSPQGLTAGGTSDPGISTQVSRSDHIHALPAGNGGSPPAVGAGTDGTSTSVARADHTHTLVIAGPSGFLTWTAASGTYTATFAGPLSVTNGGTGANLSATGGAGQYVKQSGVGAAFTVGAPSPADLPEAAIATKTTNYTLVSGNLLVPFDCTSGSLTATLPAASSYGGSRLGVIKIDATTNSLVLAAAGSDTINGSTNKTTMTQYGGYVVIRNSAGNGWYVTGTF